MPLVLITNRLLRGQHQGTALADSECFTVVYPLLRSPRTKHLPLPPTGSKGDSILKGKQNKHGARQHHTDEAFMLSM